MAHYIAHQISLSLSDKLVLSFLPSRISLLSVFSDFSALCISQNQAEDMRGQERNIFYDRLLHQVLQIWLFVLPYSTFLKGRNSFPFKLTLTMNSSTNVFVMVAVYSSGLHCVYFTALNWHLYLFNWKIKCIDNLKQEVRGHFLFYYG